MAKKKKTGNSKKNEFNNDPFSNLKGFAVSASEEKEQQSLSSEPPRQKVFGSFSAEMEMLGVRRLNGEDEIEAGSSDCLSPGDYVETTAKDQTDEELFLDAMGELTINFNDHLPEVDSPPTAMPKRMKQLKQGKLTPEASLDLHGFQRAEVADKLRYFLQNAQHHDWQTLLVITGKGLHSQDGVSILRDETEQFLSGEGKKHVVEWRRAPKQYGGDGALVLFLRKNENKVNDL